MKIISTAFSLGALMALQKEAYPASSCWVAGARQRDSNPSLSRALAQNLLNLYIHLKLYRLSEKRKEGVEVDIHATKVARLSDLLCNS